MILQRYTFGSKSQPTPITSFIASRCLWYCKDIHLEANHNFSPLIFTFYKVAYDIAKIYIWKQITTLILITLLELKLLMILQRYTFGSKSQHNKVNPRHYLVAYDIAKIYIWKQITTKRPEGSLICSCLWYCKDIHLEANHNRGEQGLQGVQVAYDIAKIYIWKQITTRICIVLISSCCLWYCKDR